MLTGIFVIYVKLNLSELHTLLHNLFPILSRARYLFFLFMLTNFFFFNTLKNGIIEMEKLIRIK